MLGGTWRKKVHLTRDPIRALARDKLVSPAELTPGLKSLDAGSRRLPQSPSQVTGSRRAISFLGGKQLRASDRDHSQLLLRKGAGFLSPGSQACRRLCLRTPLWGRR